MRNLAIAICALILTNSMRADEVKVPVDALPKSVKDTVTKRFPKAEFLEAAKETDKGKTEYDVTVKDNGRKIDLAVAPDGTLLGIEREIAAQELPKAVAGAVQTKYPKSSIKSVEEVIKVKNGKEHLEFYEVIVDTADKKTFELQLAGDGKINNVEEKKEK